LHSCALKAKNYLRARRRLRFGAAFLTAALRRRTTLRFFGAAFFAVVLRRRRTTLFFGAAFLAAFRLRTTMETPMCLIIYSMLLYFRQIQSFTKNYTAIVLVIQCISTIFYPNYNIPAHMSGDIVRINVNL